MLIKLLAGIFLVFTLIKPLQQLNLNGLKDQYYLYDEQAQQAVEVGKQQTAQALSQLIKERTEAYILNKAQALNMALQVEVTLSHQEIPIPVKVTLSGDASPYGKGRLEAIISENLGIEKENQVWT